MKSPRIIVTIPMDVLTELTKFAAAAHTSVSEQIRQAIIDRIGRGPASPHFERMQAAGLRAEPVDSPAPERRGEVVKDFNFGA